MITLPWPNKLLSPNSRVHYIVKSKAAKAAKKVGHLCTLESKVRIDWDGEIHLWITFYPPDKRSRDDDNLIGSFKHYRDGIAQALGIDDKRFRTHPFVSDQVSKNGMVIVKLTQVIT
jgi:crossover junction endodeoxyribonuclease RusA